MGVEILGVEWSYGYCEAGSGIFAVQPGKCSLGPLKESIVIGFTTKPVSEMIQILHKLAPEWMGNDYNITQKNCVKFCDEFLHALDSTLELPNYTMSMTKIGSRVTKSTSAPKQRPAITPEYLFGNSSEKRQMWIVAESIMQEYYSELLADSLNSEEKHIPSSFPPIRHARTPFSLLRDPIKTELRCMQAFNRLQRNKYQYLNSSVRYLCH